MKIGWIYIPIFLILLILSLSAISTTNMLTEEHKSYIKLGASICFIIFLSLVIFQPFEEK